MAMPFAGIRSARRSSSLLLMCVLALALAVSLQGMAAGMLAAKGPAHIHRQAEAPLWAQGFTLLSDFRRERFCASTVQDRDTGIEKPQEFRYAARARK